MFIAWGVTLFAGVEVVNNMMFVAWSCTLFAGVECLVLLIRQAVMPAKVVNYLLRLLALLTAFEACTSYRKLTAVFKASRLADCLNASVEIESRQRIILALAVHVVVSSCSVSWRFHGETSHAAEVVNNLFLVVITFSNDTCHLADV